MKKLGIKAIQLKENKLKTNKKSHTKIKLSYLKTKKIKKIDRTIFQNFQIKRNKTHTKVQKR